MTFSRKTFATIDLGSNSFHLLVAAVCADGSWEQLARHKQKVQLRSGMQDGKLGDAARQRGLACLASFARAMQDYELDAVVAVGTYTLRALSADADFIRDAEAALGYPIQILTGEEEARLIYVGSCYPNGCQQRTLIVDIGGGSTELILAAAETVEQVVSMPMGCVSFQERFFAAGQVKSVLFDQAVQAAKNRVHQEAKAFIGSDWQRCLGSSGTVVSICNILRARGIEEGLVQRVELEHLRDQVVALQTVDKIRLPGLRRDRESVLIGGLAVLMALFDVLNIEEMHLSAGGVREGLMHELIHQLEFKRWIQVPLVVSAS